MAESEKVSGAHPTVEDGDPVKKKREYKDFGHETEGPTSPCPCLLASQRYSSFL
jgi:hypothetical protein